MNNTQIKKNAPIITATTITAIVIYIGYIILERQQTAINTYIQTHGHPPTLVGPTPGQAIALILTAIGITLIFRFIDKT